MVNILKTYRPYYTQDIIKYTHIIGYNFTFQEINSVKLKKYCYTDILFRLQQWPKNFTIAVCSFRYCKSLL